MRGILREMVYLGADHGGFHLKEAIRHQLIANGISVVDLGPRRLTVGDDYPKIAEQVARTVAAGPGRLGIIVCRSGIGMAMVANKVPGIRAAQADRPAMAGRSRREENANVLTLPGDFVTKANAIRTVQSFLRTPFTPRSRYRRRLQQLQRIDARYRRSRR